MEEKLVPFDLEAAKRNPERVRTRDYIVPCAVHGIGKYVALEFGNGHVELLSVAAQASQNLRLVVVPKTKRYKPMVFARRDSRRIMLIGEQSWDHALRDDMRNAADKVRDVTFDKATGIVTVTYDE